LASLVYRVLDKYGIFKFLKVLGKEFFATAGQEGEKVLQPDGFGQGEPAYLTYIFFGGNNIFYYSHLYYNYLYI
jgi:hypothetical protein